MKETIDQIVRGSDLPLSIVIVGVGNAEFDSMDTLDADTQPLYSSKYRRYMSRDIVQFVPFQEFMNDPFKLAKETLQEIPGQLVDFFVKHNIFPNHAKEAQRKAIQNQLSLRSKVNPNQQLDAYTEKLKEKLLNDCEQMGFDLFTVQDLIEQKGLYENNVNLVMDMMRDPAFVNPLYVPKPKPMPNYGHLNYQTEPQDSQMAPQGQPVAYNFEYDPNL